MPREIMHHASKGTYHNPYSSVGSHHVSHVSTPPGRGGSPLQEYRAHSTGITTNPHVGWLEPKADDQVMRLVSLNQILLPFFTLALALSTLVIAAALPFLGSSIFVQVGVAALYIMLLIPICSILWDTLRLARHR